MTDKTQEEMAQILSYIKDATEFTKEHLPSVASQILEYGYISNLVGVIILPIITIVSLFVAIINKHNMPFFSCVSAIIFGMWSIVCLDSLIKIIYAPKVYLLSSLKGIL